MTVWNIEMRWKYYNLFPKWNNMLNLENEIGKCINYDFEIAYFTGKEFSFSRKE